MADLYRGFAAPLTHETMFAWHSMLMGGQRSGPVIGGYRIDAEPMRVVSGSINDPRIDFEAPPSDRARGEMDAFVTWFKRNRPGGQARASRADAGRHCSSVFREHPSVRGRQRTHRPCARGKVAGEKLASRP